MAAIVGSSANAQRAYSIPPETGVVITSPISGWQSSKVCDIDPSNGAQNRCINSGSVYQCIQAGTTRASGGPSGSSANETDGTAHWKWLGFNQGQSVTTGSQIVAYVARGTQSTLNSGTNGIPPTDNQGGTFTTMGNFNYTGFSDSFCGVFFRSSPVQTTSSYQVVAQFGGTTIGSGAGDELSVGFVEIKNVPFGVPHTSSHTELANSNASGICQAATITTTKPCIIISIWAGNGNVISPGQSHVAVPQGGLTMVSGCQGLVSLNNNGYIQVAMAARLATASLVPFAERWSTGATTGEGAQLFTLAFEDTTLTGNLTVTLAAETLAAAGAITNIGSASFSFVADTASSAGAITNIGSASITFAGDTVVGSAPAIASGSAAITFAADTVSAAGAVTNIGSASLAFAADALLSAGAIANIGSASLAFAADTLSSAGVLTGIGSASLNLVNDTASSTGAIINIGSASLAFIADTLTGAGATINIGASAVTLAAETLVSAGVITLLGSASIQLGADTLVSGGGFAVLIGSGNIALGNDTSTGADTQATLSGSATITDGSETVSSAGVVTLIGGGSMTLGADTVGGGNTIPPTFVESHVQSLAFQNTDLPYGPGVPRTGGGGRRNPFRIK